MNKIAGNEMALILEFHVAFSEKEIFCPYFFLTSIYLEYYSYSCICLTIALLETIIVKKSWLNIRERVQFKQIYRLI